MNNFAISVVRTTVPVLVGAVVGWFIARGIPLPPEAAESLTAGIIAFASALYYLGARWLETRWPTLGFLLGTRAEPVYATAAIDPDPEPDPGQWAALAALAAELEEDHPAREGLALLGVQPARTRREYRAHVASSVDPDDIPVGGTD